MRLPIAACFLLAACGTKPAHEPLRATGPSLEWIGTLDRVDRSHDGRITLRVANASDGEFTYALESCDGPLYALDARLEDGTRLEFHDVLQQEHNPHPVVYHLTLAPNESRDRELDVRVEDFVSSTWLFFGPELGAELPRAARVHLTLHLGDLTTRELVFGAAP